MRTDRPTEEKALEARHCLEGAIAHFADEARAPRERGTPNPDPTWRARPSTLRFSYIRNGGWAWAMEADDPQLIAFYITPSNKDPYGCVTAHGQARHSFYETLRAKQIYPTESPWREWYNYQEQRQMGESEPARRY